MSFMGLDIGTTGCKAVAFDRQGHELAFAYREYPLLSPQDGWAELNSAHVCDCCFEVIGEVGQQTLVVVTGDLEATDLRTEPRLGRKLGCG